MLLRGPSLLCFWALTSQVQSSPRVRQCLLVGVTDECCSNVLDASASPAWSTAVLRISRSHMASMPAASFWSPGLRVAVPPSRVPCPTPGDRPSDAPRSCWAWRSAQVVRAVAAAARQKRRQTYDSAKSKSALLPVLLAFRSRMSPLDSTTFMQSLGACWWQTTGPWRRGSVFGPGQFSSAGAQR
ncbi:MAG: hypothetical protein K0S57_1867 [Ramlibacter sp.]|nr:hypothetical protein [Ramlibacter sp.]